MLHRLEYNIMSERFYQKLLHSGHYLEQACALAHLSSAAYLNDPSNYPHFAHFGFTEVHPFSRVTKHGATFGFIAVSDLAVVLAFRGTEINTMENWLTNLNLLSIYDRGANVHAGFFAALATVWDEIDQQFSPYIDGSDRQILVTGHSLGGALAALASRQILHHHPRCAPRLKTYTFGQPRVGDAELDRQITTSFYRFVHKWDPVPRVILRSKYYADCGSLCYYPPGTGGAIDNERRWQKILAGINALCKVLYSMKNSDFSPLFSYLRDHEIQYYIERIDREIRHR